MPTLTSPNVAQVTRWFDLDPAKRPAVAPADLRIDPPPPGQITLIHGPSGSGKSMLLRRLKRRWRRSHPHTALIDLDRLHLPDQPLVDCFGDRPLIDVLRLLGRCGLGEAWCYLQSPAQLSDGQRWRFRLALGLAQADRHAHAILLCDEFGALLDDITAAVVARSLRRILAHTPNLAAVCATSRELIHALQPDRVITCDFGKIAVNNGSR